MTMAPAGAKSAAPLVRVGARLRRGATRKPVCVCRAPSTQGRFTLHRGRADLVGS
jgi:hypothetical protein